MGKGALASRPAASRGRRGQGGQPRQRPVSAPIPLAVKTLRVPAISLRHAATRGRGTLVMSFPHPRVAGHQTVLSGDLWQPTQESVMSGPHEPHIMPPASLACMAAPMLARPSMARFYDAMLGGKDNFAVDRALAAEVTAIAATLPRLMRQNRLFILRAVEEMVGQGITQFVDLGCGLPTADNLHQMARRLTGKARVVYVDADPVVVNHGGAYLADDCRTGVIRADIRDTQAVFDAVETCYLLDPSRPVGVVLSATLHHVCDSGDPGGLIRSYRDRLPDGSMLALTHFHAPDQPGQARDEARAAERLLLEELGSGWFRSRAAIAGFLEEFASDSYSLGSPTHWCRTRTLDPSNSTVDPDGESLMLCGLTYTR